MWTLVVGTLYDGFVFIGPFDTNDEAIDFIEAHPARNPDWRQFWTIKVATPDEWKKGNYHE